MTPYDVLVDVHALYWESKYTGGKVVSFLLFLVPFSLSLSATRSFRVVGIVKTQGWALARGISQHHWYWKCTDTG